MKKYLLHERIQKILPFLLWWPTVNSRTLRTDFLAGLTDAIVVLPLWVTFATIARMPPVYGLYAGMVPAAIAHYLVRHDVWFPGRQRQH